MHAMRREQKIRTRRWSWKLSKPDVVHVQTAKKKKRCRAKKKKNYLNPQSCVYIVLLTIGGDLNMCRVPRLLGMHFNDTLGDKKEKEKGCSSILCTYTV